MKHLPSLCLLLLLLSGCAVTPESLALIPVPEPVVIPPRYAQHLNSLKYIDFVPAILIDHQGDPVTALDVDQMKSDQWLQLWAMSAMEDDGSLDFAHSIAKTESTNIRFVQRLAQIFP